MQYSNIILSWSKITLLKNYRPRYISADYDDKATASNQRKSEKILWTPDDTRASYVVITASVVITNGWPPMSLEGFRAELWFFWHRRSIWYEPDGHRPILFRWPVKSVDYRIYMFSNSFRSISRLCRWTEISSGILRPAVEHRTCADRGPSMHCKVVSVRYLCVGRWPSKHRRVIGWLPINHRGMSSDDDRLTSNVEAYLD